jgi:hypothetical protein
MKVRPIAVVTAIAVTAVLALGASSFAGSAAGSKHPASPQTVIFSGIPVTGTCVNGTNSGTYTGTLNVTEFAYQNGSLAALGNLTGTCSTGGANTGTPVNMAMDAPTHTCKILNLVLGPLHLNLLGLVIDLSKVRLHITAESGPGRLLGNLLCAIAHLLDGTSGVPTPLAVVAPLLNSLVALLG